MRYYGLISGLQALKIRKAPNPEVWELRSLLDQYISGRDAQIVYHFFYQWDLINYNACVQETDWWMEGGNLDRTGIERWFGENQAPGTPFGEEAPNALDEERSDIQRIHDHWETFYAVMSDLSRGELDPFLVREQTLKNFFSGYMEREIPAKAEENYLSGGIFDRFSYSKLPIADIQAEYPRLAQLLSCFDESDPFIREQKMLEIKWAYYDYLAFMDPFGMKGLYGWLLKYLDLAKWAQNNAGRGAEYIQAFEEQMVDQIPNIS